MAEKKSSSDYGDLFSDGGQTIENDFTVEATKEILKSLVANYSTDLAGKYASILKDKIDGVYLSVGKITSYVAFRIPLMVVSCMKE